MTRHENAGKEMIYTDEFMDALLRKDPQAFTLLYRQFAFALYREVRTILPDREASKDILQLVFLKAWDKIDQYDPQKAPLRVWLRNIARNSAIDVVRSKQFKNDRRTDGMATDIESGKIIEQAIDQIGLMKFFLMLDKEQQQLIRLNFLEGFSHREIAAMMNTPVGTIKTRLRTALEQLRKSVRRKSTN